jgi:hypothetical protein
VTVCKFDEQKRKERRKTSDKRIVEINEIGE